MKKIIYGAIFATLAGAMTFGAAASLQLSADDIGSGATGVVSCDADGVVVSWNTEGGSAERIVTATISGIADRCLGQTIQLSLSDTASAAIADGTAVVEGSDAIVTIVPRPGYVVDSGVLAADIGEVAVTISGAVLSF